MKKALLALAVLTLAGCARPYGSADTIINQQMVTPDASKKQTPVTVTRLKQFIGSASGGRCKFVVNVDGHDVAMLRQNQFVTTYLENGLHKLRVSNDCSVMSLGMRKSLDIIADGTPQEYATEVGFWGQYRMWRTK